MKLLLTILLFTSIAAHSQTTSEIYNYITKGYITTLTQGLDFKKGYTYKELMKGNEFEGSLSTNTYQFSYRQFLKEGVPDKTLAIMVVLLKNGSVEKVLCMPAANSEKELWKQFFNDVNLKLFSDQKQILYQEITMFFSNAISALEKKGK